MSALPKPVLPSEDNLRKTSFYAPAFARVRENLQQGIQDQVFPGAVLLIGHQGEIVFFESVGHKSYPEPGSDSSSEMEGDTVFDIASLTQPIITTTLIMLLLEQGKIRLDDKLTRYIPGFGVFGKGDIKVHHLLEHTSGLIHWHPFFEDLLQQNTSSRHGILASHTAKDYVYNLVHKLNSKSKPGTKQLFSDVGYIILGELVEHLTGYSLDRAAYKYLLQPLKMKSTSFIDLSMVKRGTLHTVSDMFAPTELCNWRKRIIRAEVHDDNAWAMGGISGHGGCFSTAHDLHIFSTHLLAAYFGQSSFISQRMVRQFLYPWAAPEGNQSQFEDEVRSISNLRSNRWRYGWEGPSPDNGMDQVGFSPFAVGHSGFTGCSVWLEPDAGIDIVLLTNRIHPTRNNKLIQTFRPQLHRAILEAMVGV